MSDSRPSAAVIVCTRNRPDLLARSLPSVVASARAEGSSPVLVVDQGATPAADVESMGAVHLRHDSVGVSRGRNRGVAEVDVDVVLFTDDDCVVPQSWVSDHLDALLDASIGGSFGAVVGLSRFAEDDPASLTGRHRTPAHPWTVGHGSNAAIRRTLLEEVGGFDERMGPGSEGVPTGEDADLIARLLAVGASLVSGTGQPVHHLDWRDETESLERLLAYERGAGVWIGAALRARRPGAASSARQRWRLIREQGRALDRGRRFRHVTRLGSELAIGLANGALLRPWNPRDASGH